MQSSEVNALPDRVRRYIHDLETRCDLAGEVRDLWQVREQRDALAVAVNERDAEIAKLRETVEAQRLNIGELEDVSVQWMTETNRLRSQVLAEQEHARQAHAESADYANKLDAARAALDGERGRADSYRESHKPTSGCVDRIYAGGVLGPIQIDNRCGLCKAHDKLRAAEAKCDGCDSTRARCDGAKAGGAIKCCPECGHGAAEAKASRGGETQGEPK